MKFLYFLMFVLISSVESQEEDNLFEISDSIPLINQDYSFPVLGFGTAGLGNLNFDMVVTAIETGIKLIDTAQAPEWYSEKSVGDAIKYTRQKFPDKPKIVVVTKIHPRSYEINKMESSIKTSQERITEQTEGKSSLDVALLHSPYCWQGHCSPEEMKVTWMTAWRNLEEMKRKGRVDCIGVSNFDARLLQELLNIADAKVDIIQNWMDPFNQDRDVREIADRHGIIYMAYSSLGTQWSQKLGQNPVLTSPELQEISQKHDVSIAQVVTSWVLQTGAVAIPRSSNSSHIIELKIFLRNPGKLTVFLDDEDMERIASLNGALGALWE